MMEHICNPSYEGDISRRTEAQRQPQWRKTKLKTLSGKITKAEKSG
jgi:hypothetical protein